MSIKIQKQAILSKDKNYRYWLSRKWDFSKHSLGFIMLNPSTADSYNDDNTIIKCITYAKSWGYGGIIVVNLFAFRSTKPKELLLINNPIGYENNHYLKQMRDLQQIICAWGNKPIIQKLKKKFPNYNPLEDIPKDRLYCLQLSKDNIPKHPLYLKKNIQLIKYDFDFKD